MPRKTKPITVRLHIPDGNGGYRDFEDLTPEEQRDFGRQIVDRMGVSLNYYFGVCPDAYRIACRSQEVQP